jgi:hypothetical protein
VSSEKELIARGWEKQTTYDEPRLSDIVEMYEETGFEIRLEPFDPFTTQGCADCMKASPEKYKTIYTREVKNPGPQE